MALTLADPNDPELAGQEAQSHRRLNRPAGPNALIRNRLVSGRRVLTRSAALRPATRPTEPPPPQWARTRARRRLPSSSGLGQRLAPRSRANTRVSRPPTR